MHRKSENKAKTERFFYKKTRLASAIYERSIDPAAKMLIGTDLHHFKSRFYS